MSNQALINLKKLRHNLEQIQQHLKDGCRIAAVVKGDAYGHGLLPIARAVDQIPSVSMLVAASLDEALCLVRDGIEKPILILNRETASEIRRKTQQYGSAFVEKMIFSAYSASDLADYRSLSGEIQKPLRLHLRLDFESSVKGFAREEAKEAVASMEEDSSLLIQGLYAHIYSAYLDNWERTDQSLRNYASFFDALPPSLRKKLTLHLYSSSLCFFSPEYCYDLVRIGVLMYGIGEIHHPKGKEVPSIDGIITIKGTVQKTAELSSEIQTDYSGPLPPEVKKVALLSFGNWDLPFFFLCRDPVVSIRGRLCPIVGGPCMDSCLADITGIEDISPQDEALILGDQKGIRFDDWIERSTLNYGNCQMLFSGMERIPKRYVTESEDKL